MNETRAWKNAFVGVGFLLLLYLGYGLFSPPEKHRTRAQRNTAVNAAPRMSLSFTWSNTPVAEETLSPSNRK